MSDELKKLILAVEDICEAPVREVYSQGQHMTREEAMHVPTVAEIVAAEEKRVRDAVKAAYVEGMDESAWVGASMRLLRGYANPALVVQIVREQSP